MAAYGSIDVAKAGLLFGLNKEIGSLVAPTGLSFEFGEPVFQAEGNQHDAAKGDDTDSTLMFAGVALRTQQSSVTSDEGYAPFDVMNVLSRGLVWVKVATGVTGCANKPAYVIDDQGETDDYGKFTDQQSGNYPTNGYFRSNPVDGLALVELNGVNKAAFPS